MAAARSPAGGAQGSGPLLSAPSGMSRQSLRSPWSPAGSGLPRLGPGVSVSGAAPCGVPNPARPSRAPARLFPEEGGRSPGRVGSPRVAV